MDKKGANKDAELVASVLKSSFNVTLTKHDKLLQQLLPEKVTVDKIKHIVFTTPIEEVSGSSQV